MPFGILETKHEGPVPGTAFMSEQDGLPEEYQNIPRDFFKRGTGKYRDIILLPQPSDSPNDPLNWPQQRKELVLLVLSLEAAVVGAFGPMLTPGYVQIAKELGVPISDLAKTTAWVVLVLGLSLFLVSPMAKIYGRRPMFVFAAVFMFGTSIWGAAAANFPSLLGARVVAALGMAPFESLIQCVIGDIFFVHERGTRIAVWNVFLLAGINAGSTVSGYIIEASGFRWTFGVCAILFGTLTLTVYFYVPETAYRRDILAPVVTIDDDGNKGLHMRPIYQVNLQGDDYAGRYVEISAIERRKSFSKRLRIFNGRFSTSPFWKVFLRSIVLMFYPSIIWAILTWGTQITWVVMYSVVNAEVFAAPPYNFSPSEVGLMSLSPFVFTTTGLAISGPLNDYIAVRLTRKNKGIYEPEFRLPLMFVSLVMGTIGFFGFALTIHFKVHWTGPLMCFGAAYGSLVFSTTCVFGYVLDAYRKHNAEAFVAINSRNLLTFGLTYIVNSWLENQGPLAVFSILGAIHIVTSTLTIPLWIFGKRIRNFIARTKWIQKLMED